MRLHSRKISLSLSLLAAGCDDAGSLAAAEQEPDAPPDAPPSAPDDLASLPPLVASFEEFTKFHAEQSEDGSWVVEGDLRMAGDRELRAYYDEAILGIAPAPCEDPDRCSRSSVDQYDSHDGVWTAHSKLTLTYCIGDMGLTANIERVKTAVHEAARDWESSADVNFIHLSAQDGIGCAPNINGVVFRVRRKAGGCTPNQTAEAFFPTWVSSERELEYCNVGLALSDAELLALTKHELGHILGLQHEHYRWAQDEQRCLKGSGPVRHLTGADPYSIMGYNYCNGMEDNNSSISSLDRIGIHRLYNIPKGHGRLSGNFFDQANSFRGNGIGDDIFWYTPGGSMYSLWSSPSTPNPGAISFTKTTNNGVAEAYWRPLPVQWVSNGDANFNRELLFFGPGSITDRLYTNEGDGSFTGSPMSIAGHSIPLIGKFHGGPYSEILWWEPGNGSLLWRTDGSNNITQTTATTLHYGDTVPLDFSSKALVGSFGSGVPDSEILMYGDCYSYVTRGTGSSGFETAIVDMHYTMNGFCDLSRHIPLLGDFDGDNKGDIFWYGPGGLADRLLLLDGSLYDTLNTYSYSPFSLPVNGHYKPLVGDFNHDNKSDIFWYQPGTGGDPIWLFTGAGTYTSVLSDVDGDYSPIVGDFNNDGCDDILWYDSPDDELLIWRSDCDGTFTAQNSHTAPTNAYPVGYGIGY